MNKRFTFKFIKYISIFIALSFTVMTAGLVIFFSTFSSLLPSSIQSIDSSELIFGIEENDGRYNFSDSFREQLENEGYSAYIVDDNADTIYPKVNNNMKEIILNNLFSTIALPYKENEHVIIIGEDANESVQFENTNQIDSAKLIDSLYTHNYNHYEYYIEDNELHFIASMVSQDYTYTNEFSDMDITLFKLIGVLFVAIPLIIILLTVIIALVFSRKISRPLFFYVDWLTQLSQGLLYKPSTSHNRRNSQKLYRELDGAVDSLNTQLLADRLYQNQIDYYRSKWINQISHDLKSPLTSIYGYAKVMPYFPNDQEKYTMLISEKAKYMEELIDSLNSSFKLETVQMEVDKDTFSLTAAINEIINTVGYDNIKVTAELDDEYYYGNKLYIERMFINLIENSLDHNKINPNINIYLSDGDTAIKIIYKDDGTGLENDSANNLIKHGMSSKENKDNHGLGFSIIKDAIDFHDGSFVIVPSKTGIHFQIELR